MEVFGYDVRRSPMAVRRRLGYVPQQLSIEAALTGRENVTWFARLFDMPRAERKRRVAEALEVMGLRRGADRLAGTYSGGMVRRLELAQALVNRPRCSSSMSRRSGSTRSRATASGSGSRSSPGDGHDRPADDALHGGGRGALRPAWRSCTSARSEPRERRTS